MLILIGYSVECLAVQVNHLQFADDKIVFCGSYMDEIDSLKAILRWFELISGLKINYAKCEMVGIRMDDGLLNALVVRWVNFR